jgi:hypothetical protein
VLFLSFFSGLICVGWQHLNLAWVTRVLEAWSFGGVFFLFSATDDEHGEQQQSTKTSHLEQLLIPL